MKLTPAMLRAKENELFDALETAPGDKTFRGKLYRDGVPSPRVYLAEPVQVLFVLREPNFCGRTPAHDMRDEVADRRFRPRDKRGRRQERRTSCWWNAKMGMFAHAVASALDGTPDGFRAFEEVIRNNGWNHDVVNRFAYVQIKKRGGTGKSDAKELQRYARKYAEVLRMQVRLYQPHLVVGCGLGPGSPARLLLDALDTDATMRTAHTGAKWWELTGGDWPKAILQHYHPSKRGRPGLTYEDLLRNTS